MFRKLRITFLIYLLLLVAVSQYLTFRKTADWDRTLWVDVHLIDASSSNAATEYIDALQPDFLDGIERYLKSESQRFGLALQEPVRVEVAGRLSEDPPAIPSGNNFLSTVWWSLRMRWFTAKLHWTDGRPEPDVTLFLRFHPSSERLVLDRSTGLRKAMIAIANVFAERRMQGSNNVIITHELLHTFGAIDKYSLADNQPLFPAGFAEPERKPLYPQRAAELMGGRIPTSAKESRTPNALSETRIGPLTALEIGWLDELPEPAHRNE